MARLSRDASLDLLTSAATNVNIQNLGTVPFLVPVFTSASLYTGIRRVCITNKHAAQYVGWILSSAASPTFTMTGSGSCATTDGFPVLPGAQLNTNYASPASPGLNLWVCASAGSTPVTISIFDTELRG